jgi:HEAT repeat protein
LILGDLGRAGLAAIPELHRILNEPLKPEVVPVVAPSETLDPGCAAARALGRIAPKTAAAPSVIAALIDAVRSGPPGRRGQAAVALGEFGPAAGAAVPVLIKAISDAPDDPKAPLAAALGEIAPGTPASDPAIAALLTVLESKHWPSRYVAVQALRKFGPQAAAALPRIRALKQDDDPDVRRVAAEALVVIEPLDARTTPPDAQRWTSGTAP